MIILSTPTPPLIILLLLTLIPLILAASPTSFCKCTCFTNSTIIPLDAPPAPRPTTATLLLARGENLLPTPNDGEKKGYRPKNCNDCNRKFCLEYRLPICAGAKVEDVFTTCFQRDSRKDEAVVFIFIFATAGLLGWAMVKPWLGRWVESARERRNYIPVSNQGNVDT